MEAWFTKLTHDITSLRIQGAENVARAAIAGIGRLAKERGSIALAHEIELLLATRPTEPMMQNALHYFASHATKSNYGSVFDRIEDFFDEADDKISHYATSLIRSGRHYYTHCHSGTVIKALVSAHKGGKRFTVHNTETRPLFQGRKTAKDLSTAGIPVAHFVDSGARVALKGCAAVFLGADALLKDGKVANKIGSEMIAELAHARGIPVYILANSWKFTPQTARQFIDELEIRSPAEIWKDAPKQVTVKNYAFELIEPRYITAVITEHGIRDPYTTMKELQKRSRYLFPSKKRD